MLFITFYIIPMIIVLIYGKLAHSHEETMDTAFWVALMPLVNILATMRCIHVTVRVTIDWLTANR